MSTQTTIANEVKEKITEKAKAKVEIAKAKAKVKIATEKAKAKVEIAKENLKKINDEIKHHIVSDTTNNMLVGEIKLPNDNILILNNSTEPLTMEKNFLVDAGLNWEVVTEPMQTTSGVVIPKAVALFRNDNKEFHSIRGEGYEVYQNEQLIELLLKVSEQTGLSLHKGGYFGKGEKVFLQLKSSDFNLGKDIIEGYITGVNSFDGTTSLAFGPSNITISCQNTFFAAFKELKTKVRHTKNMVIRIEDILKQLDKSLIEEKRIFDSIKLMSEHKFTPLHQDLVIRQLFDIKPNAILTNEEDVSTYKRNRIELLNASITNQVAEKEETLWGLFSGVTHYTTHVMGHDDNNNEKDNSEEKLFGKYGTRERQIFHNLVEFVTY